ncbi:AI-2E family transporter [Candidatus Nitrospira salsa]|nr:MAG: AI-2E family transporter [Nitrospirales bacterium]
MDKIDPVEPPPSSPPKPTLARLFELLESAIDVRSFALTGLFIFASVYVLMVGKAVFLPIAIALTLSFLLAPFIRLLKNLWMPEALSAAFVLFAVGGIVAYGIASLAEPAANWLTKAPDALNAIEGKIRTVKASVLHMSQATDVIEQLATLEDGTPRRRLVEIKGPSLGGTLIGVTTEFFASFIATVILLYFLLASGDMFLEKLVKVLPTFSDKRRAVEIFREIEKSISTHLVTVTCINIGLGLAIGITMYMLGMPNPILWGVMGGIVNFVPYVGSIIGIVSITAAAALTFEQLEWILLVGASYAALTAVEGTLLSPMILGKRLTLNPVVVLLSVFLWGWIWGIPGTLLAVPIVASLKIICDQLEPLNSLGEFLGR